MLFNAPVINKWELAILRYIYDNTAVTVDQLGFYMRTLGCIVNVHNPEKEAERVLVGLGKNHVLYRDGPYWAAAWYGHAILWNERQEAGYKTRECGAYI